MGEAERFDASRYLVQLKGKDYLEVKWRLLWLRTEHPEAAIETELHHMADDEAVFKAKVSIPGGGSATGWGSETRKDFGDYMEKAETKALGRALAALGYGTQFTGEEEGEVIADSPVQRQQPPARQQPAAQRQQRPAAAPRPEPTPIRAAQASGTPVLTMRQWTKRERVPKDGADPHVKALNAWLFYKHGVWLKDWNGQAAEVQGRIMTELALMSIADVVTDAKVLAG